MFEIHLTTTTNDIEKFKSDCDNIGVKPLLIELYGKNDTYQQVMTSSIWKKTNRKEDIDLHLVLLIELFKDLGYTMERVKVEVNPNGYTGSKKIMYLESHLRVMVNKDTESILDTLCKENGFHKSKNVFKKIDNSNYYMMATLREYEMSLNDFNSKVTFFKDLLTSKGLVFDKVEIEGCIMDTNTGLDNKWLLS